MPSKANARLSCLPSVRSACTSPTTTFLQPEPGMSAGDHLVSGLVPLLVVAGAALAYGRVRAGARAALVLLLGYFGVLAGTEAVYYAAAGAVSGDDYTGFLSLISGFLLLLAGTVMLWRSRRRNDSVVRRYVRRGLIATGALAAIAIDPLPHCARLRRDAHAPRGGAQGTTRRTPRRRRLRDKRRPPPRGLVRAVPKRRHGNRRPRPLRSAKADADARASRLRRPPLRPSRRGSKRRRPERLRLGRRP